MKIDQIDIQIEFGKRIQFLRKMRKMSQEDLAFECNINKNYLSDLERGTRNPTLKIIEKLCIGFNISFEELFRGLGYIKEDIEKTK